MHCSVGAKDAQRQELLRLWRDHLANKQATLLACDSALRSKGRTGPERRALIVARRNAATEAETIRAILSWLSHGSVGSAHAEAFVDMLYCQTRAETLARFVHDAKRVIGDATSSREDQPTEAEAATGP